MGAYATTAWNLTWKSQADADSTIAALGKDIGDFEFTKSQGFIDNISEYATEDWVTNPDGSVTLTGSGHGQIWADAFFAGGFDTIAGLAFGEMEIVYEDGDQHLLIMFMDGESTGYWGETVYRTPKAKQELRDKIYKFLVSAPGVHPSRITTLTDELTEEIF